MKNIKEPFVMIMIGPTLSGKSTYIKQNYSDTKVISRDEIVMEVFGSRDYNLAFKEVDHKEVDRVLSLRLKQANSLKENVIIGRLIPAGTGFNCYEHLRKLRNLNLESKEIPNVNLQIVKENILNLRLTET